ncbi:serine protease inhibitor Kazal-type 6-like [Hippopotamus amphibius kiboko]|uniref:serine protease inhibitor Kazal-type 6-like n=1 Tax=Hippopotamus amphibius kiboko TaxID=575201 RepID=UPI002596D8CA|nr:serine protease inhibitor Kazal-type 6-like [Hippopotamus amphibius kiboko]
MCLCVIVTDILRDFFGRFDKISLTSLWIKVIFIILVFAFYSETALTKTSSYKHWIECGPYSDVKTCMKEYHPVCATNGHTYCNKCFLCGALKKSGGKFTIAHYGKC